MNKNLLLALLAGGALVVVGILIFFSPEEKVSKTDTPLSTKMQKQTQSINNIKITISSVQNTSQSMTSSQKDLKPTSNKKRDPSIKYTGMDHYHNYIIELIDKNPEDQDIRLTQNNYKMVDGKINGKQFVIKVPKEILDKPNLKLKIIDKKTKKETIINANFLNELAGLPENASYHININLNNPQSIETKTFIPDGAGAFPGLSKQ